MNKLIGLFLLLSLAACTQSSPPSNQNPSTEESVEILEVKDMTISGNLVIGSFQSTDGPKLVTYVLKNNGTEALVGPASISDTTNFSLVYQNCPASLSKGSSCTIKINFDPKNKSGPYETSLNIDSLSRPYLVPQLRYHRLLLLVSSSYYLLPILHLLG